MALDKQIAKAGALRIDRNANWIMERRNLDIPVQNLPEGYHPAFLACASEDGEEVFGATLLEPGMGGEDTAAWALKCFLEPMVGKPRRPASVTLTGGALMELRPMLEQVGVRVRAQPTPSPVITDIEDLMMAELLSPTEPPYTMVPGVPEELIGEFFEAASDFYRARPWKLFDDELPAKVDIRGTRTATYYAVVMGTLGEEFGLSVFRSIDRLLDAFTEFDEDQALAGLNRLWKMGFSYVDIDEISPPAEEELNTNKWALAGKKAYPSLIVHEPKKEAISRPTKKQLEDITAITRAFVEFVRAHRKEIGREDQVVSDTFVVEVGGKEVTVEIALPAPEFLEFEDEEYDEDEDDNVAEMGSFGRRFPEVASRETRGITTFKDGDFPAGEYAFLEYYCERPDCDCRRVMIAVVSPEPEPKVWASINCGWESEDYYRKWMGSADADVGDLQGPILDPINFQSKHAPAFLKVFKDMLDYDRKYAERLKKHYRMVRDQVDKEARKR